MRYLIAIFISLVTLIGLKQMAQADSTVNVSNNTSGGSNTHVVVNSNVTSNSTSTITSKTNVHIENNGEVKDFNTNGDESVDWQSSDGKSSVKINSNNPTSKTIEKESTNTMLDDENDNDEDDNGTESASVSVTPKPKHETQAQHSFISLFVAWLHAFFK